MLRAIRLPYRGGWPDGRLGALGGGRGTSRLGRRRPSGGPVVQEQSDVVHLHIGRRRLDYG